MWFSFRSMTQFTSIQIEMGPLRFELRYRRDSHRTQLLTVSRTPKDGPGYPTVPYWYGANLSTSSTCDKSIRRQQYRVKPKSSSTAAGSSPSSVRLLNSSQLLEITFPQVKHLTGIILLIAYLYDFWYFARAPGPPNFLVSFCLESFTSKLRS